MPVLKRFYSLCQLRVALPPQNNLMSFPREREFQQYSKIVLMTLIEP